MSTIKKPRADSKLKNLPDSDQEAIWTLMHPADAETKAWTLDAVAAHVQESYQFSVALSTLSEWHAWYALKLRMDMAAERANQTALRLAKDSDLSPEDIERVAQTVFTAETLQGGDVDGYVKLAKLRLASSKQAIEREKITAAAKTKIEAGLEALFAEIKGNKKAEALFAQLQEVVKSA